MRFSHRAPTAEMEGPCTLTKVSLGSLSSRSTFGGTGRFCAVLSNFIHRPFDL